MKTFIKITRVVVALLFIFSGLVKANDPLGLAYKMQEFFEIWNDSLSKGNFFLNHSLINLFEFLHGQSLLLSILIISFEILAGVALVLGWQMKFFGWLLLLLILFFSFLTAYAYFSGKFKNCGCFGDCIPISPRTSFLKDIGLTILIFFLFANRKKIYTFLPARTNTIIIGGSILLSLGIQWYVLNYLPILDCLPFKKGNNIQEQMKMPANAVPDVYEIKFIYQKGGKQYEFSLSELPNDISTYTFIDQKKKLIKKGKNNEPPIKGFSLSGSTNIDSTEIVLAQPLCLLLFCENFEMDFPEWKNEFSKIYFEAREKNIPVYLVTTIPVEAAYEIKQTPFADMQIFKCDYTAIRTAARTNPCLYLFKKGTVAGKWSGKGMQKVIPQIRKIN